MKSTLRIVAIFAFTLALCAFWTSPALARVFGYTPTPHFNGITITWPKVTKAAVYKVYRVDSTNCALKNNGFPPLKKYRKVATVKQGKPLSFADKKVKANRYYSYVIKAYNKNGKLLKSSFSKDSITYTCAGLGRPSLYNDGYGENHVNDVKPLHLYIAGDYAGITAKGATCKIYRKASGEKKFKLIASKKMKEDSLEYADSKVQAGTTYKYRVQFVKKAKGKVRKSRYSETVAIPAVRFRALYSVKVMSPEAVDANGKPVEAVVKIANKSKYNGTTHIKPGAATYLYSDDPATASPNDDNVLEQKIAFTTYSTDNATWKTIPASGMKLPKRGAIYLKGMVSVVLGDAKPSHFAGKNTKASISLIVFEEGAISYAGPGVGWTVGELDLLAHNGYAHQEWD